MAVKRNPQETAPTENPNSGASASDFSKLLDAYQDLVDRYTELVEDGLEEDD